MKYDIKVVTNSKKSVVIEENDRLKVYLKAKPDKGKANVELVGLLADHFNKSKKSVTIVLGKTSRNKVVEIV